MTQGDLKEFGRRVKRARLLKDMTMEDVSTYCGVTKGSVWKWENGHNMPEAATLNKLADRIGVSVDYLLCKTDDPKGKIIETVIEGQQIKLTFDEKTFNKTHPDGKLSAEDLLKIMQLLDKAGFKIVPKE